MAVDAPGEAPAITASFQYPSYPDPADSGGLWNADTWVDRDGPGTDHGWDYVEYLPDADPGSTTSFTIDGLEPGEIYVGVQALEDGTPMDSTQAMTVISHTVGGSSSPPNSPPEFDTEDDPDVFRFELAENSTFGEFVGTLTASDPDAGDILTFSTSSTMFEVDSATGAMTLLDDSDPSQLDLEYYGPDSAPHLAFDVTVTDAAGLADVASVEVTLTNVNEAPFVVEDSEIGEVNVEQGSDPYAVDFLMSYFDDVDLIHTPAVDNLTFSASSEDPALVTPSVSGETLTLTFPPEQYGETNVTVTATDSGGLFVAQTFAVHVEPAEATLDVSDVTIAEGSGGITAATVLQIEVTLNGEIPGGFTAAWTTQDDTARHDPDPTIPFTGTHDYHEEEDGVLNFSGSDGEIQYIEITISADNMVELDETFFVNLGAISHPGVSWGGDGADDQVTVTIENDDSATVYIENITSPTMNEEGDPGATEASSTTERYFKIGVDGKVDTPLKVTYDTQDTADGGAQAGVDYIAESERVDLPIAVPYTLYISVKGDTTIELDESFEVVLSNLETYGRNVEISVWDGVATGTIENDDIGIVQLSDASPVEVDEEDGVFGDPDGDPTFRVKLTRPDGSPVLSEVPLVVQYKTVDDTATSSSSAPAGEELPGELDFMPATSAEATILAGNDETEFSILVFGDDVVESDETFKVRLTGVSGAGSDVTLGTATEAEVTIKNNDVAFLSIDTGLSESEGTGDGSTEFTFNVYLSNPVDMSFTLHWHVSVPGGDGSADVPSDLDNQTGTVVFLAGSTEPQVIEVFVKWDDDLEDDETFEVHLVDMGWPEVQLDPDNHVGVGHILNDD